MRLLNILIIAALIVAASVVYKIKFDATLQAETVAKMRGQLRRERDAIALLRAEWTKLETPARLEALAKRHLTLRPVEPTQFGDFTHLPERPVKPDPVTSDPIGAMLASPQTTGSVPAPFTSRFLGMPQ
jgi:cell division protein FtsL